MPQISLHLSADIEAELERGRIAQQLSSRSEYVSALILAGAARVSGLDPRETYTTTAVDTRIGGAITTAIGLIERGETQAAIDELRFAQRVILQALLPRVAADESIMAERLRIRGDSTDWGQP